MLREIAPWKQAWTVFTPADTCRLQSTGTHEFLAGYITGVVTPALIGNKPTMAMTAAGARSAVLELGSKRSREPISACSMTGPNKRLTS